MLHEALAYLGIAAGPHQYARAGAGTGMTDQEHRELAAQMRALPARFADRLSAGARERVTIAAAGRWEDAVDELLTALVARAEIITPTSVSNCA